MFFCEKDGTWDEKPQFCVFFGIFLVSSTSGQWNQENLVKSTKKQLQGLRKLVQGTKGSILAFSCDKSADLVPEK